ncbi:MAG: substrate-binding domain-containing protein [Oscillospiraceae bacterium]|nr:substrate-binding domain-containing protein [Oscillospiraceae bacterium]
MKIKKLIALILVMCLTACVLTSCGASDETEPSGEEETAERALKVGIAVGSWNTAPNWIMVSRMLHENYDSKGYKFYEVEIGDASQVPSAVENFISSGCDIVILHGAYTEAIKGIMPQLTDAGIAVGIVDGNLLEYGVTYDMMCDEYNTGYALGVAMAEWANENCPDRHSEAGVLGFETYEAFALRGRGIRDGFNDTIVDGEVVELLDGGSSEQSIANVENMLISHPNLNLVAGWYGGCGTAAYEAVKAAGWNEKENSGEYGVFSIDATDDELNAILEGGVFRCTMEMDLRNQFMVLFEKLKTYVLNGNEYPEGTTESDILWYYPLNPVFIDRAADYLS